MLLRVGSILWNEVRDQSYGRRTRFVEVVLKYGVRGVQSSHTVYDKTALASHEALSLLMCSSPFRYMLS